VKAIILVGGEGTRLRPLTYTAPKQMLPIMGVPMLEGVMGQLASHGVDEAVLSLGYLPDRFLEAYPDGRCAGVKLHYATEPSPLDTAGAVRFAAEALTIEDTFLVVNGDVLTDLNVSALVAFHRSSGAEGTVALHPVEDPSRFGVVETDAVGRVLAFVEKPPREEATTNLINAGTYVFEPSALERIPLGERVSIERVTFPQMVDDEALYAMSDTSYWLDTGTPQAYLTAHSDILSGRRSPAFVRSPIVEGSWIAPTAMVADDATVIASVVDASVVVGSGARIEGSVILPGVQIDAGAVIVGSIVGPRASIGAGAVLEPTCVIGADARVEAGASLVDVRIPSQ